MNVRRMFLSLALAGGCIYCLAAVQQAHSEQAADAGFKPVAPTKLLTDLQNEQLERIKKAGDSPRMKEVVEVGELVAELFNLKQYAKDANAEASAQGRKLAEELVAAAKAKKADDVKRLVNEVAPLIEKSATGDGGKDLPAYKPVATVHSLMEVQQDYFNALKKAVNAGEKFDEIEKHALVLAELSNVNAHQKDADDYRNWARTAREQSLKLAGAAKDKNKDLAKSTLRELHTTCGACHDKYQ